MAFEETSAAQAEADYRSSVERAKLRLRQLHGEVEGEMLTSAGKPKNQYDKAVAMLQVGERTCTRCCVQPKAPPNKT